MAAYTFATCFVLIFINFIISVNCEGYYCGEDNCYDLLGMSRDSSKTEIVKAYRKLARQHHPDMHKTALAKEEAEIMFQKIANAYETLKDEDSRKDYDYLLDHPEENYYNAYRYYRRRLAPKVDVRVVIVVTITIISVIQYLGALNNYKMAIAYAMTVPKYRLQATEIAKSEGLLDDKRKKDRTKTKEELKEEEESVLKMIFEEKMDIRGGYRRPRIIDVLWVQLLLSPYYIARYVVWSVRWAWRYNICRQEYDIEDKHYIIRRNLKLKQTQWEALDDKMREEYIEEELWIREKFDIWRKRKEEEMKAELANSSKHKSYRRYLKKGGPGQMTFAE